MPKLSEIEFANRTFSAGDRLLARVATPLTLAQMKKIERAITKSVGEHVRILIVDVRMVKLLRVRGEETESLTAMCHKDDKPKIGQVELDCSVVEFYPDDVLVALIPKALDSSQKKSITSRLKDWAGQDVGIRIEEIRLDNRHRQVSDSSW